MSLFLLLVLLVLLQSSMAVLQIDCVGNNYTSIPDCREYLYAYMQSYTGNVGLNSGLPDVDQGYYKEEIVFTKDNYYNYYENCIDNNYYDNYFMYNNNEINYNNGHNNDNNNNNYSNDDEDWN